MNQHAGKTADQAWNDLTRAAVPVVAARGAVGQRRTSDDKNADGKAQADQARLTAQSAKDFYTLFPNDPKASEARKVEAISALRGIRVDDPTQARSALAVAQAYRTNPLNSAADRFSIALSMDRRDLSQKVAERVVVNPSVEEKRLVENWRAEFGSLPEIETHAASVARRVDPATAVAMAGQITRSAGASAVAKAEARAIQDRASLLGSSLNLTFPVLDGRLIDLRQPRSKVTMLVVFSPHETQGLQQLTVFKRGLPKGVEVVFLAIGGTPGDLEKTRYDLPVSGIYAYAPAGSDAAQAISVLKLRSAPYVYVLNRGGTLTDFGPLSEVRALLTRAGVTPNRSS